MARFQITFTTGMVIYPAKELEGGYADAKEWAEAQIDHYPPGTRFHILKWRQGPVYPAWAPCDDPNFPEC